MSRLIGFTTSPARLRPSIISSIQYRPPRPASMAPSTCWDWQSASKHGSSKPRRPRSMAIRKSIRRPRPIGGASIRSACVPVTMKASAALRPYSSIIGASIGSPSRSCGSSTPMARACTRMMGRVVSNFIVQALKGEDITIYGDGTQSRSFCYVDDLVEAMIRAMNTPDDFTGPINIGNPREFTMLQLAELVLKLTGSKSRACFQTAAERRSASASARHLAGQGGARLVADHGTRAGSRAHNSVFQGSPSHGLAPSL